MPNCLDPNCSNCQKDIEEATGPLRVVIHDLEVRNDNLEKGMEAAIRQAKADAFRVAAEVAESCADYWKLEAQLKRVIKRWGGRENGAASAATNLALVFRQCEGDVK